MTQSKLWSRLGRGLAAIAASVATGATAGAALAHKPLVVKCDDRPAVRRVR